VADTLVHRRRAQPLVSWSYAGPDRSVTGDNRTEATMADLHGIVRATGDLLYLITAIILLINQRRGRDNT
jgi:hypothetical protein